jgi:uncharacterized protein YyaL (SSP411 family)
MCSTNVSYARRSPLEAIGPRTGFPKMRSFAVAFPLVTLLWLASMASLGAYASDSGPAGEPVTGPAGPPWSFGGPLPGAPPFDDALLSRLAAAWASREPSYRPRTRHLRPDGSPKYTNRLFLQASPYLLQHAHNPVNWYPWGEEAFETARKLGRPVFLSVGYSTCHWCHVMEEESFEDEEIARYLNENYIAIKVDREERPDIDAVYMGVVRTLTGGGGWPMNVWLTPDRKPFYGGTYFPARDGDRGARLGLLTLLQALRKLYDQQPDRISESATRIAEQVRADLAPVSAAQALPDEALLRRAVADFRERFDATNGGLSGAPKFPSGLPVRLVLDYQRRFGDRQALDMAVLTLEKMAADGIYDHIGGGFHRYATDAEWRVPHFEKTLYDNALLTVAYLDGYQATGREDFARVARETLQYIARDMTSPDGAFYSASDADSPAPNGHPEEGWFFTWTPDEIETVLGKDRARVVTAYYGVRFEGKLDGRNVLYVPRPVADVAEALGLPQDRVRAVLQESRGLLYAARAKRPAPPRDEKIVTAWNGLMISALGRASLVLGEDGYAGQAERAAHFILTHMQKDGRLLRSYRDGRPGPEGYLDDYAFLIAGLIDLYEATGDLRWLRHAIALDAVLEKNYEDKERGGFFMTGHDQEALLAREKPAFDGAEPSGNSVQTLNLLRLHELTTEDRYRQRAERTLRAFGERLSRAPEAHSEMLRALDFRLDTPKEIVIVTPSHRREAEPFLARLRKTFLPNRVLTIVTEGDDLATAAKLVPLVEGKVAGGGKTTAYVCEERLCRLPTSDPEVFAQQIRQVKRYDAVRADSAAAEGAR